MAELKYDLKEKLDLMKSEFDALKQEFITKCKSFEETHKGVTVCFNHIEDIEEKENSWCGLSVSLDELD